MRLIGHLQYIYFVLERQVSNVMKYRFRGRVCLFKLLYGIFFITETLTAIKSVLALETFH